MTSESLDRNLTRLERARVWVHLKVCNACNNFSGQMDLMRRAMRQMTIPEPADKDVDGK